LGKLIFDVKNVEYTYPGGQGALEGISFSVESGESVAVLGANACGKSTLLHILDGLYFPSKGNMRAFGRDVTEESIETPPFSTEFRQAVGFLFQNSDAQLFCSTVEEELTFGPLQLGISADELELRVSDTLKLVQIEHLRDRSPQTLSGGEKKKVALAGLITCGCKVILMDEPSTALDPRSQQWLIDFLKMLRQAGITLVTASHDLSFVAEVAERVLILSEDHKLVYDGPVRAALEDMDLLLSVNLVHAHAHVHGNSTHVHPHLHSIWHDHQHG
jgi:cobalt/nickel transport system ATP-binding protein